MAKRIIAILVLLIAVVAVIYYRCDASENKSVKSNDIDLLKSLPYVSWSTEKVNADLIGVVRYDHSRAFKGYNLYTDDKRYAFLMDMNGQIIHRWQFPLIQGKWEYVELLSDGTILAICVGKVFAKLNKDSEIIWIKNIRPNHDIEVLPDGTYLVPFYPGLVLYNSRKVSFDSIAHVSASGQVLDTWSTYSHLGELQKRHYPSPLDKPGNITETLGYKQWYEYYHLNTIEALPDTPLGRKDKRFQKGNYLICLRNVSLIFIVDKDSKKIVWSWGPDELDWPHMPTMLENGNILIFDNGVHRTYSRLIEIEPLTGKIVWEYKANPPEDFYSKWRGSNQRLPNANTLICESENGRAFEITKEGKIVWEFYNPEIKEGKRHLIYRMMRVSRERVASWLYIPAKGLR